jgi:hypothetical protein
MSFLLESIILSDDTSYLLSLITDDLFSDYRRYIRQDITDTTYDYNILGNKVLYDGFMNSVTISTTNNITTTILKTKMIMKLSKQYTVQNNNKIYSYRILSQSYPIISNVESVVMNSSPITTTIETEEQVISVHVLRTTKIINYAPLKKDDFLTIPSIFVDNNMLVKPSYSSSYYNLKAILLRYYSMSEDSNYGSYGLISSITGIIFFILSIWLLTSNTNESSTINKCIYLIGIGINTFIPIILSILSIYSSQPLSAIEYLNFMRTTKTISYYQIITGAISVISTISILIIDTVKS